RLGQPSLAERETGQADTGRHRDRRALEVEIGRFHGGPEPLRGGPRPGWGDADQQQRELVAAQASRDIALARAPPNDSAKLAEHRVAGQAAVDVVDLLEVVEVEQ